MLIVLSDFYQNPNPPQVRRKQSVQVVLQEVDRYVEAVVWAEALPEVHQEVGEALATEDEGVLGEEEEEEASVLGEGVEGGILISPGLALVGGHHSLSGLALRQKVFCVWENTQHEVRSNQ